MEVQASDTIDKLKAKIRPTLDALRGIPLPTTSAASSLGTPAASSADLPVPRREPERQEQRLPQQALLTEEGQRTAGPMEPVGPTQAEILQQVSAMMEVRDQRLEAMLSQTLQHFMVMAGQNTALSDGEGGLSPDSDMGFRTVENDEL